MAVRRVLSWPLSNTLDARFCVDALERTRLRAEYPVPCIGVSKS